MSPWIVDLGESDNMTRNANIFHKYSSGHQNFTIMIADGSLSKVANAGSIIISNNLTLDFVLLIPNFNLLSISKLTRELNCVTKFFSNSFEFQNLDSGKTIGSAKMCSGLNILKVDDSLERQAHKVACVASKSLFHKSSFSIANSNTNSAVML